MRIALIAGSAEPGRDGIGDHARILAAELVRRGHAAWVLAINDPHVAEPGSGRSTVDGVEVAALRIPAAISGFRRFALAQAALDNAEAEAVLYDFSPTQYQPRGLIWAMAREMAALARGRRRALLVHEYCIGSEQGAGLKQRLWGRAQHWGFRRFVRSLNGLRIATTNLLYARLLERDGYGARIVPLYGNVPVLPPPAANWCHARLREAGMAPQGPGGFYCAGCFGALYDGAELASVLPMLRQAADAAGARLAILSVGELGGGEPLWRAWQEKFGGEAAFLRLGRREAGEVSAYIHSLDIGLATTSMALAGKSGSLAAFLDHGLPALMLNDSEKFDLLANGAAALPAGALPPTEETAARLRQAPRLPRQPRGAAALQATADWLEGALA
ncbi:MAG: glycosyltransferase [Reyranellaceae bacterium]